MSKSMVVAVLHFFDETRLSYGVVSMDRILAMGCDGGLIFN